VVEQKCVMGMAYLFLPRGLGDLRLSPVFIEHDVAQLVEKQHPVRLLVLMHHSVMRCGNLVNQLVAACPDVVVAGGYVWQHTTYSHVARYARSAVADIAAL